MTEAEKHFSDHVAWAAKAAQDAEERERGARGRVCSGCGAGRGKPCKSKGGRAAKRMHKVRYFGLRGAL